MSTQKVLSFFGTCSANAELTLVSQPVQTPFRVIAVLAHFALNTNRALQLDVYLSPDDVAPSSGRPNGISMCREYSQAQYITGDDETKTLHHELISPTYPSWLKVYANNTDAFDHTVDVQVEIEILERD